MDFCKSCEELHAVSRIPLTIVHQEGEVRLALPAGHEDLIPLTTSTCRARPTQQILLSILRTAKLQFVKPFFAHI